MDEKYCVFVYDLGLVYGPFDSEDDAFKFVEDNAMEEAEVVELKPPSEY